MTTVFCGYTGSIQAWILLASEIQNARKIRVDVVITLVTKSRREIGYKVPLTIEREVEDIEKQRAS